jgi:hypothetical protein
LGAWSLVHVDFQRLAKPFRDRILENLGLEPLYSSETALKLAPFHTDPHFPLALIAGIVAAVYDCRSSRLSSGFGCKNKLLSSEANEDFTASAEQGYTSTN